MVYLAEVSVVEDQLEKIQCGHCKRFFPKKDFYQITTPEGLIPAKSCKKCMASLIDLESPSTIKRPLKELDLPYIPFEWNQLRDRYEYTIKPDGRRQRNPNANQSILGRYVGKMKLKQFNEFRFEDTPKFEEEHEQAVKEESIETQKELEELMKNGYSMERAIKYIADKDKDDQAKKEELFNRQQERELRLKWGDMYTQEELMRLERFYAEMHSSYDITTASHEDYLKQICKVSLRMNSMIDNGMYDEYNKLSNTYDKMMKSAKFTASQEKVEDRFIDSISEMVKICEQKGFIPQYHKKEPQDIVDVTLRDLNNYTKNLVMNELNLDSLIEKGMEQIKLDEEKEKLSADDALFDEDDLMENDDLLFETDITTLGEDDIPTEEDDLIGEEED